MTNLSDQEKEALSQVGTVVIRFGGTITQNEFRLFNGRGIGALTGSSSMNGPSPLEFHIRINENIATASDAEAATFPNSTIYTNNAYDWITPEYVATPLWGAKPDISFWVYDGNDSFFALKEVVNVTDVNLSFTVEMEPLASKLN
tara:strand:+ start:43 stop:477 length:435 start_codon:yes stop_codon:yes gene_type:complete